ncbi:MAG TPA: type II toxin-antitoxin system VapC family toxin [Microbacteriaceae bacterium]|nr:type II toxin-antitoxin system VapC family toxin [Microbacteriaceae bacterium]
MTLVVDASALSEYLIGSRRGLAAARAFAGHERSLHMPHLAVSEVTSVLRSWVAREDVTESRARGALEDLADFPATRYAAEPFLTRIWQLRHNLSSYDAHYVALAEALAAPLLTADARIAHASGHHADVLLLGETHPTTQP